MTLSVTGFGLIGVPISAAIGCALSFGHEVVQKIMLNISYQYKK